MKNIITFEPLIETFKEVYCHLLTINNTRILINCGGDSSFYTQELLNIINSCDCILVTSFDSACINGLWTILDRGYFKPVYMSVPIKEYSLIFHPFEYKNIFEIKYLQPFNVNNVQICAFASGNSLGASLFKITSNLENIYVGYNINHRKENHLNGIDLKNITDSYVFITNTNYCIKENINSSTRNEQFLNLIKNWFTSKNKKMIIYVTYPRLHEIGLLLNTIKDKKIVILDKYIKKFINKSKNMIEWSNTSLIEQNDVYEYSNIEKVEYYSLLNDFDICILLDDDISLLDKFNDENLCVIFIDKKFNITHKPIYQYNGSYEIKTDIKENDIFEESSEEEIEKHWSELKNELKFDYNGNIIEESTLNTNDLFLETYRDIYGYPSLEPIKKKICYKTKDKFNLYKKIRNYDDYGEYIDKEKFVVKIERNERILEPVTTVKVYSETKKLIKSDFIPKCKMQIFNLQGSSDLKNIKVILQNIDSKKILLVEDSLVNAKFMYSYLLCAVKNVQICNSLINLSSSKNINILNVSDIMNNMENEGVKVYNSKMFRFKGFREDDKLKYIERPDKITVCDFNNLTKKLMSVNLKIEKNKNVYVVQDKVRVKIEQDKIILDGEVGDIYYHIKDIIYDSIISL